MSALHEGGGQPGPTQQEVKVLQVTDGDMGEGDSRAANEEQGSNRKK